MILSCMALYGGSCAAQYRPAVTVKVDTVLTAGIYRIVLPPPFVARCGVNFSDLRIFDEAGKETPYVLRTNSLDRFNAGYLALPDPKIVRKDSSDHHSYYYLHYNDTYRIDRLSLVVASPALYKRIISINPVGDRSNGITTSFGIDPADTVFHVTPMKGDNLVIEIENDDNAPLAITRVASAQSGIYLLTYVEPGHSYRLMAGDPKVGAPKYDLHYFTDSTSAAPATIGVGTIEPGMGEVGGRSGGVQSAGKSGQVFLWSVVTVILLLLLYVSVRLARAIDKKGAS
jgi:hypothetical protein